MTTKANRLRDTLWLLVLIVVVLGLDAWVLLAAPGGP